MLLTVVGFYNTFWFFKLYWILSFVILLLATIDFTLFKMGIYTKEQYSRLSKKTIISMIGLTIVALLSIVYFIAQTHPY
jgi:hypothetical protein